MSNSADITNDFDSQSFNYNGNKYFLEVMLCNATLGIYIPLHNSNLDRLDYETTINNLIMTGNVFYTDTNGKLDKILGESYNLCTISFEREDPDITSARKILEPAQNIISKFQHTFLVNKIAIEERQRNFIKYRLELISINWNKLNTQIKYSNYAKGKESITDIIKNILKTNGLKIDEESFDKHKSPIEINYLSNVNDTAYTSIQYLFRRMYYDKDDGLEPSIKILGYSILKDMIYLCDLNKKDTYLSQDIVPMSMFGQSSEDVVSQELMDMGYVTRVPTVDFLNKFKKRNIYKYNSTKNEMEDIKNTYLCEKELINNYFNNISLSKELDGKFKDKNNLVLQNHQTITEEIKENLIPNQEKFEIYWNNNENIYQDMVSNLIYYNAIVLNIDGFIARSAPGELTIIVDREFSISENESANQEERIQQFRKFEGSWITTKVRHMIFPIQQRYKTNVVVCRNWTTNIKNI